MLKITTIKFFNTYSLITLKIFYIWIENSKIFVERLEYVWNFVVVTDSVRFKQKLHNLVVLYLVQVKEKAKTN